MDLLANAIIDTVIHAMWLMGSVAIPLIIFTFVVHRLEILVQTRLAERFGWKSVLWTGWLGTPIHELSHAAMCVVFRHKIIEMKLFEPDLKTGRLGYVKHSWSRKNWYEEVGNVFIGLAPLMGGSIVLAILLLIFYPGVSRDAVEVLRANSDSQNTWQMTWEATMTIVSGICDWGNLLTSRFWAFVYLVLCVGTHMAPSRSDYEGAGKGIFTFALIVVVVVVLLCFVSGNSEKLLPAVMETMAPIFAVLLLSVILSLVATIVIYLVTIPFKQKYVIKSA